MNASIFDIQGFSVHDGPGCRTLVFMKGCTMNCRWCSNPEGISPHPIPLYNPEKCILNAPSDFFHNPILNSQFSILNSECNTGALKIAGYYISVEDLYNRLQRDRNYWGENGGITLTGGEPFFQPEFATEILKKCFKSYIHTAIETCGNVPWKYYADAIDFIDWLFYDIKIINNRKHKEWTGVSNKLILDNAEKISKRFKGRLIIRIPIVPEFNDSEKDVADIADFMNNVGFKEVNILPLHHLGREKYKLLGLPYFNEKFKIPTKNKINLIKEMFEKKGLLCYEGYKTPF